jgi:uncharacterized protein YsxB (DUF464 family)
VIRITARLTDGRTELVVEGHEGHLRGGQVCAAITAITQTAILGLEAYAEQFPDLVSIQIKES